MREARFPEGCAPMVVTAGYEIVISEPQQVPAAIGRIESAMTPADREKCEDWLVMLQAALAGGKKSAVAASVALELYVGALRRYPADVAKRACEDLATKPRAGGAWFPALPELVAELERQAAPRKALLDALRSWRPPTEADRLNEEARGWLYAASEADELARRERRGDVDVASEAAEFAAFARDEAKRLRIQAAQERGR